MKLPGRPPVMPAGRPVYPQTRFGRDLDPNPYFRKRAA
jgi:hypothetical protein